MIEVENKELAVAQLYLLKAKYVTHLLRSSISQDFILHAASRCFLARFWEGDKLH
jgi:hypothetical protein